jgi:hypothetical protein
MALIFSTTSVVLGAAAASFTITHALGTAPDFVYITPRGSTTTTGATLYSSTTQIVLVAAQGVTAVCVDVEVVKHHSLIG